MRYLSLIFFVMLFAGCNDGEENKKQPIAAPATISPDITYNIIAAYPHDTTSFTEGLLMHDGKLYESTGAPEDMPQTNSLFGEVDLRTGKIDVKARIDREKYFGEGIVFLHDKIYQLTYINKTGFIYDAATFRQTGQFTFPSAEGWGLTTDSSSLIMSDGSDTITYLDPGNFKTEKILLVKDENGIVRTLNELEFIKGNIFANIWGTNTIVIIDTATAKVIGRINADGIAARQKDKYSGALEMNGIAYDPAKDRLYITGKMWADIYELEIEMKK